MGSRYGLQIRAALATDAKGVAELLGSAGLAIDPRILESRIEAVRAGPGALLLADEWGPPSGLVAVAWSASLLSERPVARVELLLVAQENRRRGIARTLLKAASQAARAAGCGDLVLASGERCESLDAFCRATGFEPSGRLHVRSLRKRA